MKIVQPYALIVDPQQLRDALKRIEAAARISHRSEDGQTSESAEKFIRAVVLGHGDWSVVEHVNVSVEFLVDRGITHEIVRHRLASYTQESTRFVNYAKKMPPSYIYPKPDVVCDLCAAGDEPVYMTGNFGHISTDYPGSVYRPCKYDVHWLTAIHYAEQNYRHLLDGGWRPQEARSVFPNALASKILMTCNLRNWRQFFCMRTTKEAHPQMRQVTIPLLAEFQKLVPVLFEEHST